MIGLPFLSGLGAANPIAFQLSVATGVAALILTILTDHQTGLIRVLSYRIHLIADFLVGVVLVLAPIMRSEFKFYSILFTFWQ